MQNTVTPSQVKAALAVYMAILETVREAGSAPAGPLYAALMGQVSHEAFGKILASLERTGLIKQTAGHMLQWTGPARPTPFATAAKRGVE